MTAQMKRALAVIAEAKGLVSPKHLARELGAPVNGVTRTAGALVRLGLVRRVYGNGYSTGQGVYYRLTTEGARAVQ